MAYDSIANYEVLDIEAVPHGEVVVTASGEAVLVRKAGGRVRYRLTASAHFLSHPGGMCLVGQTLSYRGVEFVVEQARFSGMARLRDVGGVFFDARTYEIQALSTGAYDSSPLESPGAGEALG